MPSNEPDKKYLISVDSHDCRVGRRARLFARLLFMTDKLEICGSPTGGTRPEHFAFLRNFRSTPGQPWGTWGTHCTR